MFFIIVFIIFFIIIIVAVAGNNTNSGANLKISNPSENQIKSFYKLGSQKNYFLVPSPAKVSIKEMLDFIEKTDSFNLEMLTTDPNFYNLIKSKVVRDALQNKANNNEFDRKYYNSLLVDRIVNEGFEVEGINFKYQFSFPLKLKDQAIITKISEQAHVYQHLTIIFKNNSYLIKLAGAIIGSVPDESIEDIEKVYSLRLYLVIEQMPAEGLDCIVSVNVSNNPRPLPKSYLDKQYEVKGVFVKSRKDHIDENCNEGDEIFFKDEYSNKYDSNAVQIICRNKIIGYVSKFDQVKINKLRLKDLEAKIYKIYYIQDYLYVYYKLYSK